MNVLNRPGTVIPRASISKWRAFVLELAPDRVAQRSLARAIGLTDTAGIAWAVGKAAALPKVYPALAAHLGLSESEIFRRAGLPFDSLSAYSAHCRSVALKHHATKRRAWKAARPARKSHRRQKWEAYTVLSDEDRAIANCMNADRAEYSKADLVAMVHRWDCQCAYCGERLTFTAEIVQDHATIDHIVPTSAGGPDTLSNLVPACYSCNSSKQGADLQEWSTRKCFAVHPQVLSQYKEIHSALGLPA